MEKVLKALKCVECDQILCVPVVLPCTHLVCKSHTEIDDEEVTCRKCGESHPNEEFKVMEAVNELIRAGLGDLNFGCEHTEATRSCDELKQEIDKNESIFRDMDYFIHESVDTLKNRVHVRSEQLKTQIDEITAELIDDLDEYEKRCQANGKNFSNNENFETVMQQLRECNQEAKRNWEEWSRVLHDLRFDRHKYMQIKQESDKTVRDVREKSTKFETELFMNEFGLKNINVEFFENAQIDPVLRKKANTIFDVLSFSFIYLN